MASPSFSWLKPSMLRRSRTREPTWMSIGFGLSPFRRPGRRVCCCIAIFGRSPSQRQRNEVVEYTIVRDEQPTRLKEIVLTLDWYLLAGRDAKQPSRKPHYDRECAEHKECDKGPVARAGVECGLAGGRERDIGIANRIEIDARPDSPCRIDYRAYSIVRDAHHRQSFLDGAGPSAGEMLKRTRTAAVPCVVRQVQDPIRAFLFIDDRTRENGLVANRRGKRREPR